MSEVGVLHQIAADCKHNIIDRVFTSHVLMALYARARHSDFEHVDEVLHDTNTIPVSIQGRGSGQPFYRYKMVGPTP